MYPTNPDFSILYYFAVYKAKRHCALCLLCRYLMQPSHCSPTPPTRQYTLHCISWTKSLRMLLAFHCCVSVVWDEQEYEDIRYLKQRWVINMAEYFCTHTLPGLPIKLKAHWQTCRPPHKPHICHFISHNAHCITVHPVQVKQKLFALCAKKLKRCPHCPIWGASNTKLKALELWRHQNPQHIPSKHTFETATCTLHTIQRKDTIKNPMYLPASQHL